VVVFREGEMHRDRLVAGAYFQLDAMVLQEQAELLQVVVVEQIWAGECGLKAAGAGDKTKTQSRAFKRILPQHGAGLHPHKWVTSTHVAGQGFAVNVAVHGAAQMGQA
jgi:hypothetical protein